MSRKNPFPKIQHYVPQFILKNFTTGKKQQIYVFDKEKETVFKTHIKNVASERSFYNFEINGYEFSIEPSLEKLDTQAAELIDKILQEKSLSNISEDNKVTISGFIAVQIQRTRYFREKIRDLNKAMTERIRQFGFEPSKVKGFERLEEKGIKEFSIKMLMKDSEELVPHILDKKWLLYETTESNPFYVSDNPVARQNRKDYGLFWGNLGLAVKGIEIYFPLAKTLSLAMLCQSHEETFWDTYKKYKTLDQIDSRLTSQLPVEPMWLENLKRGFEIGAAIPMRSEGLINHNSLQVKWSSRFVFSSDKNFKLIRDMISTDPSFKKGLGIRVS